MKITSVLCAFLLAVAPALAAVSSYQLSTHVLDTSLGKPGKGVVVTLEKQNQPGEWIKVGTETTNEDGRISSFLKRAEGVSHIGVYRFTFKLEDYFQKRGETTVFPEAVIVFRIGDDAHYHIPLVVTPFALSTYRGS